MDRLDKKTATKRAFQRDLIVELLRSRGEVGATSEELNRIGFRYSSTIFNLRRDGYHIETRARKGTELARFILWALPGEKVQQELFSTEAP